MTFLRTLLWRICSKNIYKITCPTEATFKKLSNYKFLKNKLSILHDPIIETSENKKN